MLGCLDERPLLQVISGPSVQDASPDHLKENRLNHGVAASPTLRRPLRPRSPHHWVLLGSARGALGALGFGDVL